MNFLDAAKILQRLEFRVDGVAKRRGQLVTASRPLHVILAEIADHQE